MKKRLIITLVILAALIAAACGYGYWLFQHYQEETVFLDKTTLNEEPIGGETPDAVADALADYYNTAKTHVDILENSEPSIEGTLEDFGYECDRASFETLLRDSFAEQRKDLLTLLRSLYKGYSISSEEAYTFDESLLRSLVQSSNLAEDRFETVDPSIAFDEETRNYYVVEGYEGNMIDDAKLQALVLDTLQEIVEAGNLPEQITIDIPDEVYTSVPPVDNISELQAECDARNLELRKQEAMAEFDGGSVTYTFGSETVTLDTAAIREWLSIDDDLVITLNEDAAREYVTALKAKYDTQYLKRTFQTTTGKTITFPDKENEYGYRINYSAECEQLIADIWSKEAVTREPVYYKTNDYGNPLYYQRNGTDDLCGTYVEVNLTRQHLWFYVNGSLIIESDIVSGCVEEEKETQTGVFPLAFKQSPRTLTGDEAGGSGSYSADVQYWMPFYDGQGLHDAPWRGSFGGNIYLQDGSHGCVNLPPSVAGTIYRNIEVGMPIILYKE